MTSKKTLIYKVGFIGLFVWQLLIIVILPYFLFKGLVRSKDVFQSDYFTNNEIWMYFLFLFVFSVLGIIINFFNLTKNWKLIKMFLLMLSVVPMPLVLPFILCQFIDKDQFDIEKNDFSSGIENKKEASYRKIGLYGLVSCNIIIILWILVMFNIGSFFSGRLKVDYSRMPVIFFIIYTTMTILSLVSTIISLIFKKNVLILITAIISFPLWIGGVIFAAFLFLSLKKYFNRLHAYYHKFLNLGTVN